jgi:hypothetical protein
MTPLAGIATRSGAGIPAASDPAGLKEFGAL